MWKSLGWLVPVAASVHLAVAIAPAQANCAMSVGSAEPYQLVMQRRWRELQQAPTYPWGQVRPYSTFVGERMTLTPAFEQLMGSQKQQVITTLLTTPPFDQLTPAEQEAMQQVGGPPPYRVYASDGRLVSAPYDGCTRPTLLTERDRYSWYFNSQGRDAPPDLTPDGLRNAGRPSWRVVRVPITAEQERHTRLRFWQAVGWNATNWWIAWVPETGYFELNVPVGYNPAQLERFWRVAPRQQRYVVVANDGTVLQERRF